MANNNNQRRELFEMLQQDIRRLQQTNRQHEADKERLVTSNLGLMAENKALKNEVAATKQRVAEAEARNVALRKNAKDLGAELEMMSRRLTAAVNEIPHGEDDDEEVEEVEEVAEEKEEGQEAYN